MIIFQRVVEELYIMVQFGESFGIEVYDLEIM